MRTVITYFYNEEYLLPWWLEHHRKIFDFGILIDYHSTDRSTEIIRDICPNWQIITSENRHFDTRKCDNEVEFCERQLQGWRMALNVTEFLVGDINKLTVNSPARMQWYIPGIRFTGWNLEKEFDTNKLLWEQHITGVPYESNSMARQCRSLHNFNDLSYPMGRKFNPPNTEDAMIFHYGNALMGMPMFDRRLQVQYKVSPEDRYEGLHRHHYADGFMTLSKLKEIHAELALGERDCTQYIDKVTKYVADSNQ